MDIESLKDIVQVSGNVAIKAADKDDSLVIGFHRSKIQFVLGIPVYLS